MVEETDWMVALIESVESDKLVELSRRVIARNVPEARPTPKSRKSGMMMHSKSSSKSRAKTSAAVPEALPPPAQPLAGADPPMAEAVRMLGEHSEPPMADVLRERSEPPMAEALRMVGEPSEVSIQVHAAAEEEDSSEPVGGRL